MATKKTAGMKVVKVKRQELFTLDDAFRYEERTSTLDTEKVLRAAGLLLDFASRNGTEEVHGAIALGVAQVARKCAEDLRDYMKPAAPEYRSIGGEFVQIEEQRGRA